MKEAKYIWMDGKIVKWKEATVHILCHTLHYGNSVFEGTRVYKTDKGIAIFKLKEHTKRLLNSAKITHLDVPYTQEYLEQVQIDLVRQNDFQSNGYIRPLVYCGYGEMGVIPKNVPTCTAIAAWEWGAYLGDDALENGISVGISSFTRSSIRSTMGKAKVSANYFNSQMAGLEAIAHGYDEALLLNEQGTVAEGSGECFFIVRDGVLITPPNINSLESITQKTVIEIAKNEGIEVERRDITRDEVYIADEAFFTGTAAEVTPIVKVDQRMINQGTKGAITSKLQKCYFDVVNARDERYIHYLTFVNN